MKKVSIKQRLMTPSNGVTLDNLRATKQAFSDHPLYLKHAARRDYITSQTGGLNPYFQSFEPGAGGMILHDGEPLIDFSSYDYLGLNGDSRINEAATAATQLYGTSVSSSRIVSGERTIHRELEARISELLGTQDTAVFLGGYVTNESTIGHIYGRNDLIVTDSLTHASVMQGAMLSNAKRLKFPHNDYRALDELLTRHRPRYRRVLVVIEGVYGVDGDIPDVPRFVNLKHRHGIDLMIDEAHSIGVVGETGAGIKEHFSLAWDDIDIWMGTLSKSFASAGGYISGSRELIEMTKYTTPGFVFSVGMPPASAAAALAAVEIAYQEPFRATKVKQNARSFLEFAQRLGLEAMPGGDSGVVIVKVGDDALCIELALRLRTDGLNIFPIAAPAVPVGDARLRLFVSAAHSSDQLEYAADRIVHRMNQLADR